MLGAPAHLLTRLNMSASGEHTGLLALPTSHNRLSPRLLALLTRDNRVSANLRRLATRLCGLDASLASDFARRLGLGPLLRRAVL